MNIKVHIERIILEGDGFANFRPESLRSVLEHELQQQLARGDLKFPQGAHLYELPGHPLTSNSTAKPNTFATELATSLSATLRAS